MLGIVGYDSDSDSDTGQPTPAEATPRFSTPVAKPLPLSNKPQRAPKKITIALPALSSSKESDAEIGDAERPAKKRKTGGGSSSLLSMLPVPKRVNPVPQPQRVLGGGSGPGLNFLTPSYAQNDTGSPDDNTESFGPTLGDGLTQEETSEASSSTLFRPTSLAKGRKNISVEETSVKPIIQSHVQRIPSSAPAVDFFSLGLNNTITKDARASTDITPSSSTSATSSAPIIQTFEPPEPTPTDPYPGYYQLPSGAWAAYDAEYYGKFMKKWEKEYNAHVRALEKGAVKGFEGLQDAAVEEIDALKEMERAKKEIQEREEKKAMTMGVGGAPAAPRMNINASKLSGIARSRHQLSTLLKEAYENREALEEKIAQGKRNRKEAGNKYGTCNAC